jgi:hypothetical protein
VFAAFEGREFFGAGPERIPQDPLSHKSTVIPRFGHSMARVVNILPLFYLFENHNSLNLFELLIKQVLASELLFY